MIQLALVVLVGCSRISKSSTGPECEASAAEAAKLLHEKRTVVLGDFHGSREIPSFVGAVACAASKREPVIVALEATPSPGTMAYLDSDGSEPARALALSDEFWRRPYQDGRSSVAAFELIERLRQLRRAGRPVELLLFDVQAQSQQLRDQGMAERLIEVRKARPEAAMVVMVGDLHARRTLGGPVPNRWMGTWLVAAQIPFVSLKVRRSEGTAWFCNGADAATCGPRAVGGSAEQGPPGQVVLNSVEGGAYDGTYVPGATFTASPPVAFPELSQGFDAKLAALKNDPTTGLRARAMKLYEARDFAGCAKAFEAITSPSSGDAYNHACCLARAGKKDEAFERLTWALQHGAPGGAELQQDEDLASLHGDPRWPR